MWGRLAGSRRNRGGSFLPDRGVFRSGRAAASITARSLRSVLRHLPQRASEDRRPARSIRSIPPIAAEHAEIWEKVVRKLRAGTMPPVGRPRPDKPAVAALIASLETGLDRAAAARPNPGRPPLHRLNRTEYANAIRDLLALDVDVPRAAAGRRHRRARLRQHRRRAHGVAGADGALPVRGAQDRPAGGRLPDAVRASELYHAAPHARTGRSAERRPAVRIARRRGRAALLPGGWRVHDQDQAASRTSTTTSAVWAGRSNSTSGSMARSSSASPSAGAAISTRRRRASRARCAATPNAKTTRTMPTRASTSRSRSKAGTRTVGVFFVAAGVGTGRRAPTGSDRLPARGQRAARRPRGGRQHRDRRTVQDHGSRRHAEPPPDLRSARRRAATKTPCAKRILSTLGAPRLSAPASRDDDVQTLVEFYDDRPQGRHLRGRHSVRARAHPDRSRLPVPHRARSVRASTAGAPYRLSDLELASRLSFFLWSSIPDDELLDVAARGRLKEPGVLEQQVRRMLADPRANALVDNFAGQWLVLRNIRDARARSRSVSRLRREPARGLPARNRAVPREPARARTAASPSC